MTLTGPPTPDPLKPWQLWAGVALLCLCLLVPGGVALHVHLQDEREAHVSFWKSTLERLADSRTRAVRSWLGDHRSYVDALSRDPSLTAVCLSGVCPTGNRLREIQAEIENWSRFAGFVGVYVFSPEGDLLLQAQQGRAPSASAEAAARRATKTRSLVLHDVHEDADGGGTPTLGFLAPVFASADPASESKGPVLGVVACYLDPRNTLYPVVADELFSAQDYEVYLVDRGPNGVHILTPVGQPGDGAKEASIPLEATDRAEASLFSAEPRSGWLLDYRGQRVLASGRPVPGTDWGVVAKADPEVVLGGWRRNARWEVGLMAVTFLCVALGVVAAWRSWTGRRYRILVQGIADREQQLRALATGTKDVVFIKDLLGRYTLVNQAAARILGAPAERILGFRAVDFLPEAAARAVEEHDRAVLESGRLYEGEEVIPVSGEDRTFLSARIPIRDAAGQVRAVAGVLRDITARKRNEEALNEEARNRRRAEACIRRLHDATASLTGEPLFRAVVLALAEELGVRWAMVNQVAGSGTARVLAAVEDGTPRELPPFVLEGTPCNDVITSRDLVNYPSGMALRLPGDAYLARRGVEAYAGMPVLDSDGRVLAVLCAFHDLPLAVGGPERDLLDLYARRIAGELERIQAEQVLARTRRAMETLIQNLPGAVYRSRNARGRSLEYVSAGSAAVTGHPPETFGPGGIALEDLIVPDDRERVWREIQGAVAQGKPYEVEYRIHDAGGTLRWVYDVGRPVPQEDGEEGALEGVLFDHTDRRSLEVQLTHSQRMEALGRLAGGVAHDFNNLLTAISGYAELLQHRYADDERGQKPAREIIRTAERAAALTRQLLAFSRRQVVEPKHVLLHEAVGEAVGMLARLLGEDVELVTDLSPQSGAVRADTGQLEQILMNLAVNARDAMPRGGRLSIRTFPTHLDEAYTRLREGVVPGPYAVLEVEDTGTGMEQEVVEHAFEPFFTTKGEGKGTGLGLATVYGIVKQAGGHVSVYSEPGRGSTFRVYWPLSRTAAEEAAPVPSPPSQAGRGESVLLAEDDQVVRQMTAEHLTEQGYRLFPFASGLEALEALPEMPRPDVVVTDVMMPGLGGPELARRIRERWPETPVVYVSGHTGPTALDTGEPSCTFLQKPFRLDDLDRAIRTCLADPPPDS